MKDSYYFPHTSGARYDPKIVEMLSVYKMSGYGWFWVLLELLREQDGYKLDLSGKYSLNALAMQMYTDSNTAKKFIDDCVNEFHLFESDGNCFWSNSLKERMEYVDIKREKARDAANKRWQNRSDILSNNADAMQTHSDGNASKVNKSKVDKSKVKEIHRPDIENIIAYFNQKFCKNYKLTDDLVDKVKTRLKTFSIDQLIKAIEIASSIPFYIGLNDSGWSATPKWLFGSDGKVDEILNKEDEIDLSKILTLKAKDCFIKKDMECDLKISTGISDMCKVCFKERAKWMT